MRIRYALRKVFGHPLGQFLGPFFIVWGMIGLAIFVAMRIFPFGVELVTENEKTLLQAFMVLSFFFILIGLVQRGIEYVFPADGS